ncbi:MAG: hypothetical protein PWP40_1247 [Rhodocyclaceae bacterium]|nr:hypothetical protein [Rhodocyclaceae bacterium]
MHEDTAATAADWLPYRARQSFNLFEIAALLCRQDPERLVDSVLRARSRDVAPMCGPDDPAMALALFQSAPEMMLGDDVGGLLKAMQKALGVSNVRAPVSIAEAQRLAALFGIDWPPELQAAGAHQVARFCQGGTAAPAADRPASSASTRSRFDTIQVEIDDVVAALEGEGKSATPAKVMARLRERAGKPDSCIYDTAADGVLWTRGSSGEQTKLTMQALKKRISRDAKGTLRTPTGSQGR